jgi:hypothetical protein
MDDRQLQRRILVVVVTTRSAASSLGARDGEVRAAVQRGIQLLDGMAEEVARDGEAGTREQLDQAKVELASLLDGESKTSL